MAVASILASAALPTIAEPPCRSTSRLPGAEANHSLRLFGWILDQRRPSFSRRDVYRAFPHCFPTPARVDDTTKKLLAVPGVDERHVFLMTGSLTDRGVEQRLRRIESALPTRPPELPDGITHLWLVAQFGDGPAALWSKETGWTTVVVRSA
jgi:hypothetical protein